MFRAFKGAVGRAALSLLLAAVFSHCSEPARTYHHGPADAGAGEADGSADGDSGTGGTSDSDPGGKSGTAGKSTSGTGGKGGTSRAGTAGAQTSGAGTTGMSGATQDGGASTTDECAGSSDCPNAQQPICRNSACFACRTSSECAAADDGTPYCDAGSGKCVQCTVSQQCSDAASPICASGFVCVGCGSVGLAATACAQRDAHAPICAPSGECVQCTVDSDCDGTTPICDPQGLCQACSTDAQCVSKLGANPGVCMAHQDGRCATDSETIYVENAQGCSTALDNTSGTTSKPYCTTYVARDAVSASRRLMVVRGSAEGFSLSGSGPQLTVVGQLQAKLFPGNDPSTSSCVALDQGANLYIRDILCNTNYNAPAIIAQGSTVSMENMVVFDSGGGIQLDASNFAIVNTILSDNESGVFGTTSYGGMLINNPPSTGPRLLKNVTFEDQNRPNDIHCSAAINGTGVYAPDAKVDSTCGITTCSTPGASCGSSLTWTNPG
jgi:hypothetical protein